MFWNLRDCSGKWRNFVEIRFLSLFAAQNVKIFGGERSEPPFIHYISFHIQGSDWGIRGNLITGVRELSEAQLPVAWQCVAEGMGEWEG